MFRVKNQYSYMYSCSYYVGGHFVCIVPCQINKFKKQLCNHLWCLGYLSMNTHRIALDELLNCAEGHLYCFKFKKELTHV